jgi:hypothetical protein
MIRFIVRLCVVCSVLFMFSNTASASMSPGTWSSADEDAWILVGTWSETFAVTTSPYGFPSFIGSTMTASSSPSSGIGSWSISGTRGSLTYDSGFRATSYPGATSEREFTSSVVLDVSGYFTDGLLYSGHTDNGSAHYTMYFNGTTVIGLSEITWRGTGEILDAYDNPTGYTGSIIAKGNQTWSSGSTHGGDITFGLLSVPIPGAVWLLGSGLLGLLGLRRRRLG